MIDRVCTSTDIQTLVILDNKQRLECRYTGPKHVILEHMFLCFGMVCDKHGHILLGDYRHFQIHVFDKDGTFIDFIIIFHKEYNFRFIYK